tara:strand:- start:157 stop:309 length:153 start_codon:yes stop_codon:yes gene_type:complete
MLIAFVPDHDETVIGLADIGIGAAWRCIGAVRSAELPAGKKQPRRKQGCA